MAYTIGLPRERLSNDARMLLLPSSVSALCAAGISVLVERGLGERLEIRDSEYEFAGAQLRDRASEVWNADLVLKLKAPVADEFRHFKRTRAIAGLLHAEGDLDLVEALLRSRITAFTFEFFQDDDGTFPLMSAGGTVAGQMAIFYAAHHLQIQEGGRGILFSSIGDHPGANVVIIGSGNVGRAAAELAARMGADVHVLCSSSKAKEQYDAVKPARVRTRINSPDHLSLAILDADVVVGAILESTFDTPPMVSEDLVRDMKNGSVIVDVTAGYGPGYLPTFSESTSFDSPSFVSNGVVHVKIGNLPAAVPRSSVARVNEIYLTYLRRFASSLRPGGSRDVVSERGKIIEHGEIVHKVVDRHWRATRN